MSQKKKSRRWWPTLVVLLGLLAILVLSVQEFSAGGLPLKKSFLASKLLEAFTQDRSGHSAVRNTGRSSGGSQKSRPLHSVSEEDRKKLSALIDQNAD